MLAGYDCFFNGFIATTPDINDKGVKHNIYDYWDPDNSVEQNEIDVVGLGTVISEFLEIFRVA